jgi:hypothetical protein
MSHVWCHGPNCHTYSTQDRVRGSKGSKVLRTRKVRLGNPNYRSMYSYFCSNGCYNEFANKYVQQIVRIAPRTEPLETPIEVSTETREGWNGTYTDKTIKKIDRDINVG